MVLRVCVGGGVQSARWSAWQCCRSLLYVGDFDRNRLAPAFIRSTAHTQAIANTCLWVRPAPTPTLRQHGLVQAPEWVLKAGFQDFLEPLFCVVLDAGLGVCDALVEGKGGSFMSVMVRSVHHHSAPHITTPCGLFGCDVQPWLTLLFLAWLSRTVLCWRVCLSRASTGLSQHGVGVGPLFCLDFLELAVGGWWSLGAVLKGSP